GSVNNYTLEFTFANPLTRVAGAAVNAHDPGNGSGSVTTRMIDSNDPHRYIVNLSNVSTGQYLSVTLSNVAGSTGNTATVVSPQMGVLVGDVNASGVVTSGDVNLSKQQAL